MTEIKKFIKAFMYHTPYYILWSSQHKTKNKKQTNRKKKKKKKKKKFKKIN